MRRYENACDPQLSGDGAAMQRSRSAKCYQAVTARIDPYLDSANPDGVHHVLIRHLDDGQGCIMQGNPHLPSQRRDSVRSRLDIQLELTAKKIIRVDAAQQEIGISNCRVRTAVWIRCGAGTRASALGSHAQKSPF